MTEADDILAAEYALGLLSPDEAAAVEARFAADAPLSVRVAWWRDQLSPLAVEASAEPGAHVWPAIAARLGANDTAARRGANDTAARSGANDNLSDPARPWKWATGAMTAVAATLLATVALRPDPAPVQLPAPGVAAAAPMVASLSGESGAAVTVACDTATKRMLVTPVVLDAGTGDAELWVIPVGATVPVSLGVIDAKTAASHALDPARIGLMLPGATFAISQEAKGGSPTGAPQGAIVASGKIIRV